MLVGGVLLKTFMLQHLCVLLFDMPLPVVIVVIVVVVVVVVL